MARAGAPGQLRPSPPLEEAALCVPGSPLDKGPAARAKQAAAAAVAVAAVPPATPVTTAFPFRIFLSFHRTGSVTDTHTPIVKCATLAVREDGGVVWSSDGAPFAHPACRVCYRLCRVSVCRLVMNSHLTSRGQKTISLCALFAPDIYFGCCHDYTASHGDYATPARLRSAPATSACSRSLSAWSCVAMARASLPPAATMA